MEKNGFPDPLKVPIRFGVAVLDVALPESYKSYLFLGGFLAFWKVGYLKLR